MVESLALIERLGSAKMVLVGLAALALATMLCRNSIMFVMWMRAIAIF